MIYSFLQYLLIGIILDFKYFWITMAILTKLLYVFYLFMQGYEHWWVGILPYGHLFVKMELSALHIVWGCVYVFLTILCFLTYYSIPIMLLLLAVGIYTDIKFCYMYIGDFNKYVYGFIPGAKYVYMAKEVYIACKQN